MNVAWQEMASDLDAREALPKEYLRTTLGGIPGFIVGVSFDTDQVETVYALASRG